MIPARYLGALALCVTMIAATPATLTLERELLDIPSAQGALDSSVYLNRAAHYAGTPADHAVAIWMRDKFTEAGLDATIEPFTAEVYSPTKLALRMYTNPDIVFDLHEVPIPSDPDGTRPDAGLPFNAGSGSATVVAQAVDAGHGMESDYAGLKESNTDITGKIALVRYGGEFRGDLARRAQANGATGVIFFSDPADDPRGARYPYGPNRPLGSVQRGTLGTPELKIPVLPITDLNAQRIIGDMTNHVTKDNLRLEVREVRSLRTLWNTVGTLHGNDPTQSVLLGAHRDAWVYGVTDNGSGTSILIEVARALGYLHRSGWNPQRNITIIGFDGEEIGEAGSNTYVRMHQGELRNGAIAYFNTDEGTTGQRFGARAVSGLTASIVDATKFVRDPHSERQTIYDRWLQQPRGIHAGDPGGGSDHESFLYDLGIPVAEVAFSGEFGTYHSGFDDIEYARRYADTGFVNHRAIAQILALLAKRYADLPTLPYSFSGYADDMRASLRRIAPHNDPQQIGAAQAAVDRFAAVAATFDAHPNPARNGDAFAAARMLDRVLYERNGYAAIAFPDLAGAPAAIDAATARLR